MTRRFWTAVVGIAAAAALIVVPSALAAYTSAKLQVTSSGMTTTVRASLDPNDDPTASVRIFVPTGTQLTTNQAPGTVLGPVKAIVKALDLAGADLPLDGQLIVAPPGSIDAATVTACTGGATPIAAWVMNLTAAGQQLQVPVFLVGTTGALTALGPAYMQICLPPPDVPAGTPGRATFGAKVYLAELTVGGVFSPVPLGAWIAVWTPYNPGKGTVNVAGTIASPAAIAPGAVTLTAKKLGKGARLRSDGDDLRRREGEEAQAHRTRQGRRERGLHLQGEGRDVLPGERRRSTGDGRAAVSDNRRRDRTHPVREPDRERVHGAEQDRPQEVGARVVGGRWAAAGLLRFSHGRGRPPRDV
jgi:hypothetical protein